MKTIADVTITPQIMAEAFWNMSSIEQKEFFEHLHDVVNRPPEAGYPYPYSNGEEQWWHMAKDVKNSPKAHDMATSMFAYLFLDSWWDND